MIGHRSSQSAPAKPPSGRLGFTLIEIMVVIGIMAIVLATSVPMIYRVWHKEPMRKAISELFEVFSNARAQAILQGKQVEVVFYPRDGRAEVSGAAANKGGGDDPMTAVTGVPSRPDSGLHAEIPEGVAIEMLDINLLEYKDSDSARVRFFPNGTSDELTLILHSDRNEWRKVTLEVTTGLADVGDVR